MGSATPTKITSLKKHERGQKQVGKKFKKIKKGLLSRLIVLGSISKILHFFYGTFLYFLLTQY